MPKSPRTRREFLAWLSSLPLLSGAALRGAEQPLQQPIKIAQIGVGHAHASKLGVYRRSRDYEVVGIAEPDADLRKRSEGQEPYRDLPWLSQEQLLSTPGLQAVLIETRVRDSLAAAEAAVNAGMHIHLDKPAGADFAQFQRIVAEAERRKLLIQMGYMFRYNPGVRLLQEMRRDGWLGELFEAQALMSKVVGTGDRKSLAEFPGGIQFELGCHVIDLVVGLLGRPEKVTPFIQHASPLDDRLMDNMLAVFRYPRALASVKASALEVGGFDRRHLTVCGTGGTFHIQPLDNPSVRVALAEPHGDRKGKGVYEEIRLPKYTRYVDDAADMARIIRGEKPSDFSYEHDLAVQETVLRASGMWQDDAEGRKL